MLNQPISLPPTKLHVECHKALLFSKTHSQEMPVGMGSPRRWNLSWRLPNTAGPTPRPQPTFSSRTHSFVALTSSGWKRHKAEILFPGTGWGKKRKKKAMSAIHPSHQDYNSFLSFFFFSPFKLTMGTKLQVKNYRLYFSNPSFLFFSSSLLTV